MTGDVHTITIHSSPTQQGLGFSIRGGSEHGLCVYVSDIDRGSVADVAGLEIGDKIIEVNNISLQNVASSSAAKVMSGSSQLKLLVERTGHVPEWRLSKEKTAWHDSHNKQLISGDFEQCGTMHYIRGLDVEVPERRVTLSNNGTLGLNIRGGNEYGLGIYISSVDVGSEAEQKGVRVGDQVIDVNGVPFDNIPHTQAVDVMKSDSHLILTLRDVGRYPAFKELFAEYTWSRQGSKSPREGAGSRLSQTKLSDTWIDKEIKQRNPSLHMKVPVQVLSHSQKTGDISHSDTYTTLNQSDGLPLQSEIYLPHTGSSTGQSMSCTTQAEEEEEDDLGSVSLDLWQQNDGYHNEAYLHHNENSSHKDSSQSDTDDESGIHGEYDITMEDIIARAKKSEKFHFQKQNVSKVLNGCKEEKKNSRDLNSNVTFTNDSPMSHDVHDDRLSQDEAVCVLSPMSLSENESNTESVQAEIHFDSEDDHMRRSHDRSNSDSTDPGQGHSVISSLQSCPSNIYSAKKNVDFEIDKVFHSDVESIASNKSTSSQHAVVSHDSIVAESNEEQRLNPYQELQRQTSTGFSILEAKDETDEGVTMRDFDEQILSLESHTDMIEMDSLSSESKAAEAIDSHLVIQESKITADESKSPASEKKTGKWQILRNKLKGSLRGKGKSKSTGDMQKGLSKDSKFERSFVTLSQVMHKSTVSGHSMKILEESAQKFLSSEELSAVMKHIRAYHESHDIERLVDVLLTLLDKPEKILLLRDIRTVVYPVDLYKFEQLVNMYEVKAYEKLSTKLHLYLNHDKRKKPKKNLLVTEIDEYGRFYVKSVEQIEREHQKQQMVIDVLKGQPLRGQWSLKTAPEVTDESSEAVDKSPDGSIITVNISKQKPTLGLCVSGGSESKKQPQIKVEKVIEGGAAYDVSDIKAGMVILSIDDESMVGVKHGAAVEALKKSFGNNVKDTMKIVMQTQTCDIVKI